MSFRRGGVGLGEREVFLDDARPSVLPGDFRCGQPGKRDETAVVHDTLELPDRFNELRNRFLVRYLLRDNPAPAERGEVALSAASFSWSSLSKTSNSSGSGTGVR